MAKGAQFGPNALSVSSDGKKLVFIGPSVTTVSVLEVETLNEVCIHSFKNSLKLFFMSFLCKENLSHLIIN